MAVAVLITTFICLVTPPPDERVCYHQPIVIHVIHLQWHLRQNMGQQEFVAISEITIRDNQVGFSIVWHRQGGMISDVTRVIKSC